MNFQEFVRSKGITQTQLGDAMGCGRSNISKWATGECFPNPSSIRNMIEGFSAFGIEVTYDEIFQALLWTKRERQNKA